MPDDWGNALVRWVVLLELEAVICATPKEVDAPNHDARC